MQLQVHVRESFLHVLSMRCGIIEMTLPQPQIAGQSRNLTIRVKAGLKQPAGMESFYPLRVIHVGFGLRSFGLPLIMLAPAAILMARSVQYSRSIIFMLRAAQQLFGNFLLCIHGGQAACRGEDFLNRCDIVETSRFRDFSTVSICVGPTGLYTHTTR